MAVQEKVLRRAKARALKLERRFSRKGMGDNQLARIVAENGRQIGKALAQLEESVSARNDAIALLKDYEFDADPMRATTWGIYQYQFR